MPHRVGTQTVNSTRHFPRPRNMPSGPSTRKAIVVDVDMTNRVVASETVTYEAIGRNFQQVPNRRD